MDIPDGYRGYSLGTAIRMAAAESKERNRRPRKNLSKLLKLDKSTTLDEYTPPRGIDRYFQKKRRPK